MLTTEQLRARAKFWREKAVEAKWESVSIAQDMLLNADAFDELAANREAQPVACDIERIKRHALPAGECPRQSQVVLLSSLKRLLTAPPAPAVPESIITAPIEAMLYSPAASYVLGWNDCRAAMLAAAPEVSRDDS